MAKSTVGLLLFSVRIALRGSVERREPGASGWGHRPGEWSRFMTSTVCAFVFLLWGCSPVRVFRAEHAVPVGASWGEYVHVAEALPVKGPVRAVEQYVDNAIV